MCVGIVVYGFDNLFGVGGCYEEGFISYLG